LLLGTFAVAVGAALLWSAFLVHKPPAAVNVLAGAGVSIFLFLPLYWIQDRSYRVVARVEQQQRSTAASVRELSGAVETVQEQVRETNLRIDELGPATLDLITQQRNDDEQVIRRFVEAPTWKSTQALFNTARNLNAVGDSIACELGSSGRWLFFGTGTRPARAQGYLPALEVMLDFSEPEMRPAASVYWTPNEDAQVFMQKLANRLKQIQKYPGDRQFDASAILQELADTIKLAVQLRHEGRDIAPLYALISPDWALTERGMESLGPPATIPREQITGGQNILPPAWVAEDTTGKRTESFHRALELAKSFF